MSSQNRLRRPMGACAVVTLICVALLAGPAIGQRKKKDKKNEQFSDVTSVTVIEVPVNVSVKDEPVRGLTADDFTVLDGRKEVEIVGFDVIDLSETEEGAPEVEVTVAARRHFLAFFDLSYSDPSSVDRARESAASLVMESLHPSDLVAVATYSRSKGPRMVLGFTTDRNQIRQAIETLGFTNRERPSEDPLGLVIGDLDRAIDGGGGLGGGGADSELQANMRELQNLQSQARQGEESSRLAERMDGLAAVAQMMDAIQGRKHVLYLSEGFDSESIFGRDTNSLEDIQDAIREQQAAESGQYQNVNSDRRYGNSQTRAVVDRALRAFRQSNCSIQAVDIGGLQAGTKNKNLDSLRYMARETGGDAFANTNNLGEAMGEMLARTSVTYVLAIQPSDLPEPGEFRELTVKLENGPRGADVSHRPGYYAPRGYAQQSAFERQLSTAQKVVGGQEGSGSVDLSVLAGAFEASGKAYVPVLVEVDGSSLSEGLAGEALPLEIYAYALDSTGAVRSFFNRGVGLDMKAVGPAINQSGVKYWGHFDLAPGEYTVRVLVRNSETGADGIDVSHVTVPGGADTPSALLPPLFPEPVGYWLMLREEESEQRAGIDFPFMAHGEPFIPAARPKLSGGSAAKLQLVAYNLGAGALSATAQLLSESGETVTGSELTLADDAAGNDGMARLDGTLVPAKAPAGDYTLVVNVKNLASGSQMVSSLPVTIGG